MKVHHPILIVAGLAIFGGASSLAQTGGGLDRAVKIVPRQPVSPPAPIPDALPHAPPLQNTVDLKLEILTGPFPSVGSTMAFQMSATKPGYVILVDIDAAGKLTQIFPNILSLAKDEDKTTAPPNKIAAHTPTIIPQPGSKIYEFVASPPPGIGMVIAIYSETPLDVVDLPDVPQNLVGTSEAVGFVRDAASSLRIVSRDGNAFQDPKLSFNAVFYAIK